MISVGDETIKISNHVIVVGIIRHAEAVGRAFLSRSKRCHLHVDEDITSIEESSEEEIMDDASGIGMVEIVPKSKQPKPVKDPVEVDLFKRSAWREPIYGEMTYQGQNILLGEGPLLKAIRLNKPLIVYNPPDDDDFKLLMHHVNGEGKLFHNGIVLTIPATVFIETRTKVNANSALNVSVHAECDEQKKVKRRIYIGVHNWHELYKQLVIQDDGTASTMMGGLLEAYNPAVDVIYLNGVIPQSYWQALISHIQHHYSQKVEFLFHLAPGAAIENVTDVSPSKEPSKVPLEVLSETKMNVFVSNDVDFVTQQITKSLADPLLFYVTPKTTFNDLIASTTRDVKSRTFTYTEHGILKALKSGRTVMLSGEMSLALYFQLKPLFDAEPHLISNGKRMPIPGRLIAVMPENAKDQLPGIQVECNIDPLSMDITFVIAFFQSRKFWLSTILSIRSQTATPWTWSAVLSRMSYQRVKMMLDELADKDNLHQHNPIKGLFNYDYPRRSEDQAHLNVLGKHFFRPNDNTRGRHGN